MEDIIIPVKIEPTLDEAKTDQEIKDLTSQLEKMKAKAEQVNKAIAGADRSKGKNATADLRGQINDTISELTKLVGEMETYRTTSAEMAKGANPFTALVTTTVHLSETMAQLRVQEDAVRLTTSKLGGATSAYAKALEQANKASARHNEVTEQIQEVEARIEAIKKEREAVMSQIETSKEKASILRLEKQAGDESVALAEQLKTEQSTQAGLLKSKLALQEQLTQEESRLVDLNKQEAALWNESLAAQDKLAQKSTAVDEARAVMERARIDATTSKESIANLEAQQKNLEEIVNDEKRSNEYIEDQKDKLIEISNSVDALTQKANNLANATNEALQDMSGYSPAIQRAVNSMRDVAKETEKVSSNIGDAGGKSKKSSTNFYYIVRAVSMASNAVNDLSNRLIKLSRTAVTTSGRVLKAFGKMALGMKAFSSETKKSTKAHDGFLGSMKSGFFTVLKYTLGIRSLYMLMRKLRGALSDGMKALALASDEVNAQMSSIVSNLSWMKNMIAVAVQPLLRVLVPVMNAVANAFDKATYAISSFFAVLTGQSYVYKAIKPMEDYANAVSGAGKAAKDAANGIRAWDKLNVLKSKDDSGAGGGAAFNKAETEKAASELAKKVKKIFATIFDPMQKAWKSKGKFVMDSWKQAIKDVGALAGQVGRDFLTVWSNDTGVKIWKNIFQIVGDVGKVIGNIATQIRLAWAEGEKGLHIFEAIQGLFDIIIEGIRRCADATVEWSAKLDFNPLLQSIYNWLESLRPVIQTIVDIFTHFWTDVLLPFRQFVIEEGLPKLFDTLAQINGAIDWDLFSERMQKFMDAFEPFLEKAWQALLIVLQDIGEAVADFVNSEGFGKFIDLLVKWMNEADPEEMAKSIESFAKAIITLTVAFKGLSAVVGVLASVLKIVNLFRQLGLASGVKTLATSLTELTGASSALSVFAGGLLVIAGAVEGIKNFFDMWENGVTIVKTAISVISGAIVGLGLVVLGIASWPAVLIAALVGFGVAVVAWCHEHWEEIKEFVGNAWTAIKNFFTQTIPNWWTGTVVPWFKGLIDGFIEKVKGVGTAVKEWWTGKVIPWFKSLPETVKQKLQAVVTGATNKLAEFKNWWKNTAWPWITDLPKNIVDGIKNGIGSLVDTIKNVGKDFFKSFLGGFKDEAGIHSPSKVMEDMMDYIVQGAENGVEDGTDDLGKSFAQIFTENGAIDEFYNNFINTLTRMRQESVSIVQSMSDDLNAIFSNMSYLDNFNTSIASLSSMNIPNIAIGNVTPDRQISSTSIIDELEKRVTIPLESTLGSQNAILTRQNEILTQILAKKMGITSREIFDATRQEATDYFNRTGNSAFVF